MITLPIVRPVLPSFEEFFTLLRPSWKSGMVTNGSLVKELEKETCRLTQAAHAVALTVERNSSSSDPVPWAWTSTMIWVFSSTAATPVERV